MDWLKDVPNSSFMASQKLCFVFFAKFSPNLLGPCVSLLNCKTFRKRFKRLNRIFADLPRDFDEPRWVKTRVFSPRSSSTVQCQISDDFLKKIHNGLGLDVFFVGYLKASFGEDHLWMADYYKLRTHDEAYHHNGWNEFDVARDV